MASICVHRAPRTPLDSTPGHIRSRDGLQEDHRPATHGRADPASPFPAIHLTRQSPFYGPPRHIRSRDGIDLCPSSTANPSRQPSRAHPLARWFAGRTPTCHAQPCRPCIPLSCNSSDKAITFLRAYRAYRLARWFAGRSPTCHTRPCRPCIPLSCNSSGTAIAILRWYKAYSGSRWNQIGLTWTFFVS